MENYTKDVKHVKSIYQQMPEKKYTSLTEYLTRNFGKNL